MCGLLLEFSNTKINQENFKNGLSLLSHRGPDNNSILQINQNLILGHTRLSIQDLSKFANQPMTDKEGYSIIFNGEIYNFKELKNELLDLGEVFFTASDTEVLIKWPQGAWRYTQLQLSGACRSTSVRLSFKILIVSPG